MVTNDAKRAQTKLRIKNSLMELYANKGFFELTVSMVCNHAKVHRSTFYAYYNNLNSIIREVEEDLLAGMKKECNYNTEVLRTIANDSSKVYAYCCSMLVSFYQWQYEHRSWFTPLLGLQGDLLFINKYYSFIFDTLQEASKYLGLEHDDYDLRYCTGGVFETNKYWLQNGQTSAQELVERQMLFFFAKYKSHQND